MSDNSVPASVNSVQNETNVNDSSTICVPKPGNGMSKVLLIDECSGHDIPKALKTLMSSLVDPSITDLTVVLLYIMTVETGFIPSYFEPVQRDLSHHFNIRRLNALTEMPFDWKEKEASYKLSFVLPSFPDTKCRLICSKTLECLSVCMFHCDSCDVLQTFSMLVNPSEFIECQPSSPVNYTFKNLKQLSINFKNLLPLAVRSCVLEKIGLNDGLLALPEEVLYKLCCDYLCANDFLTLTSTCKFLYDSFSNDDVVWKRFVIRKFGESIVVSHHDLSCKDIFKMKSIQRRNVSDNFVFRGLYSPQLNPPFRLPRYRVEFL